LTIIDDPGIEGKTSHSLDNIFFMTICAVICGADGWSSIAAFCKAKESWFTQYFDLPNGTPSHDTLGTLFSRIDPELFQQCFSDWVQSIVAQAFWQQLIPSLQNITYPNKNYFSKALSYCVKVKRVVICSTSSRFWVITT
jgi:hypothetical protein